MISLRFRDLTVPDGQTIGRHQEIIDTSGAVWWGWIMRQAETFPSDLIMSISERLEEVHSETLLLYHSGTNEFYRAEMTSLSALPNGARIRSPELQLTPPYMHESVCPAWFEFSLIESCAPPKQIEVLEMPTLPKPSKFDIDLKGRVDASAVDLRESGGTMWVLREPS